MTSLQRLEIFPYLDAAKKRNKQTNKQTNVTGSEKRYIVAHIFKIELLAPRGRVSFQQDLSKNFTRDIAYS